MRLGIVSYRQGRLNESLALLDETLALSREMLSRANSFRLKPVDRKRISNVKTRGEIWQIIVRFNLGDEQVALKSLASMYRDYHSQSYDLKNQFSSADLEWLGDLATVGIEIGRVLEIDQAEQYFLGAIRMAQSINAIIDKDRLSAVHDDETFYHQFAADNLYEAALFEIAEMKHATNHPQAAKYDYMKRRHAFLIAPFNESIDRVDNEEFGIEDEFIDEQGNLATDEYWRLVMESVEQEDLSLPQNLYDLATCNEMLASIYFQSGKNKRAKELLSEAIELREDLLDSQPENEVLFQEWINSRLNLLEFREANRKSFDEEMAQIREDIANWEREHAAGADRGESSIRWHNYVLFTLHHLKSAMDS